MSYPKIKPCPRCGTNDCSVYKYDDGQRHVECNNGPCWYLGPGESSIRASIKSHNDKCSPSSGDRGGE